MVYPIDPNNPDPQIIKKVSGILKEGLLAILPTDTAYMLAANALDEKAVKKVFEFKNRPYSKPIHVAVPDLRLAKRYVVVNEDAKKLAKGFLPGPLTLILPKSLIPPRLPNLLTANRPTAGIRIPDNSLCLTVLKRCGVPLTATSVNISSQPATYSVPEMETQFGKKLKEIALILDVGELPRVPPSTIVDLSGDEIRLLRKGPISGKDILETLNIREDSL